MSQVKKHVFKILFTSCIAFIILAIWYWIAIPELNKLDENYHLVMEYAAQSTNVRDVYGVLEGPFYQTDVLSEMVIGKEGNIMKIKSTVTGKKRDTGETVFHVEDIYNVDAKTLMHVDKPGMRWGFLPGVEKRNYEFFHPAVFHDDPMTFKKTEKIHGIETYNFEVVTKGADTSRAFPQFAPHTIYTDTTSKLWIEPITGQMVKFEKSWDNYLVENGKRVNTIQVGGKTTTEFTELILVEFAKSKIDTINFQNFVLPAFITIAVFSGGIIWILGSYLRKLRGDARKQEKMALIGNTTASVSHNLRNPLNVINLSLNLLDNECLSAEKKKEHIESAKKAVSKISYHIDSMMNFVKESPLELKKTTIQKILKSSLEGINMPKEIQLRRNIPEIILYVDEKQMEVVFSNLILNAIQAIKKGTISILAKETSDNIQIEFIDSGSGIPENKKSKIFVPLYTSKQVGTGLGLSSCKRIVEGHGGKISVQNNPTRFIVKIPKK